MNNPDGNRENFRGEHRATQSIREVRNKERLTPYASKELAPAPPTTKICSRGNWFWIPSVSSTSSRALAFIIQNLCVCANSKVHRDESSDSRGAGNSRRREREKASRLSGGQKMWIYKCVQSIPEFYVARKVSATNLRMTRRILAFLLG